jgi:hypothetical protein
MKAVTLFSLAILTLAGCRSATGPDPALDLALEPSRHVHAAAPTDAPELRNIRAELRGDRLVIHAQIELNGWERSDLADENDFPCSECWTFGGDVGSAELGTDAVSYKITGRSLRIEADMIAVGEVIGRPWITWTLIIGARHEGWGPDALGREDFRGYWYKGSTPVDGAPQVAGGVREWTP